MRRLLRLCALGSISVTPLHCRYRGKEALDSMGVAGGGGDSGERSGGTMRWACSLQRCWKIFDSAQRFGEEDEYDTLAPLLMRVSFKPDRDRCFPGPPNTYRV
jgi:hypothetical protein